MSNRLLKEAKLNKIKPNYFFSIFVPNLRCWLKKKGSLSFSVADLHFCFEFKVKKIEELVKNKKIVTLLFTNVKFKIKIIYKNKILFYYNGQKADTKFENKALKILLKKASMATLHLNIFVQH